MKIYMDKTETHTYKVLASRVCDMCGKKGKGDEDWNGATYDVNETEITIKVQQKEGFSCPDGGHGKNYDIDICPTCFKGKLVPWLISQGANIKQEDWDW